MLCVVLPEEENESLMAATEVELDEGNKINKGGTKIFKRIELDILLRILDTMLRINSIFNNYVYYFAY